MVDGPHAVVMQAVDPSPVKHNPVTQYLDQHPAARYGAYAAAVFLGSTLLITAFRLLRKYNSPNAKKRRSVNKNLVSSGPVALDACM